MSERPVDEGETEKGKPQKGDYRVDPNHVPGLEDESEEENEAPPGLGADESSSIGNEGVLEQIQYQLAEGSREAHGSVREPKEVPGRLFSIVFRWSTEGGSWNRILIS